MVENTSVSEHAWLFVASSTHWQRVVNHGSFGVKPNSPSIRAVKEARPGELCVAFVTKEKLFAGLGKITGSYYNDKASEFSHRVQLQVKLDIKNGVLAESIVNDLQFITNKTKWWSHLQRALRRIPISDYKVIEERLKEGLEKLTENEVRELISIPIEPIDTHTKAEGALLELGNCLEEGYETYVTPDDKNKEFRGKSLGEIATLREPPEDFIPPGVKDTVRHIDVIWFKKNVPAYCFEVEHSTAITQALAKFSDLTGLTTEFMIVAPAEARGKFKKELERTLFVNIKDKVRFRPYDELAKFLAVAQEFAKEKQNFFGQHRVKED